MKASESCMYRFLDGADKKFIIPVYQRPYSWKKSNCKELFNDLMEVYKKGYENHFFGSIVYVAQEDSGHHEYIIIDGQQRITTVSLLLLAIRNYILSNETIQNIGIKTNKITNAYLIDEYADEDENLKLKLIQEDKEIYEKLVKNEEVGEPDSNIVINYNYFLREISKLNADELKGLYDSIMKLVIVNISLNPANGDDPQLIFESLNSTGLDLLESDKIRNYVLMNMSIKEQERIYKKYWKELEKKVRDDINKFIRYYLAVKTGSLANEKNIYIEFKKYKQSKDINIEDILKDMIEYAELYRIIKCCDSKNKEFKEVLKRLNKLENESSTPGLLGIIKAYKDEKMSIEELINSFSLIENYLVRRNICSLPTNQLNKIFSNMNMEIEQKINKLNISYYNALEQVLLSKTGKSRFPNNHDFHDKFTTYELYNAKGSFKKYFFERLENENIKEKIAVEEQIEDGTLTIEHIMPQTLTDEWKYELGNNWEVIHNRYKDTIGNLTLSAYNSEYSNLTFKEKKEMKDKGFNSSRLYLNESVRKFEQWNEKTIQGRAEILYKKAENIWWIPKIYSEKEESRWIYWDDEFDFTNKKIKKLKFKDEEIDVKNMTDAYKFINDKLNNSDAVTYRNIAKVSENENDFRSPYKLNSCNLYIETNLSSLAKAERISELASGFDFNSEDLKLWVDESETK